MTQARGGKIATLVSVGMLAAAFITVAPAAEAATTTHYTLMGITGPDWYNYDNIDRSIDPREVDWAVALVFRDNAEINKVKDLMLRVDAFDVRTPATKHMNLSDQTNIREWDDDAGMKKGPYCPRGTTTLHYRVYADADDDRLYNPSFGFFVIGTAHKDTNECGGGTALFHGSEAVEDRIGNLVGRTYPVQPDRADFFNKETYHQEVDHLWENDGLATYLYIA